MLGMIEINNFLWKLNFSSRKHFLYQLCSQTFKYPAALKKHSLTHVPQEHVCRICNTAFESESDVRTHKENVHTVMQCHLCPATFPTNQEEKLLVHMERVHHGKDRENAICADCGSQFKTQNQLKYWVIFLLVIFWWVNVLISNARFRIHNTTKCGTVKQFQCEQCESKFMTQNVRLLRGLMVVDSSM